VALKKNVLITGGSGYLSGRIGNFLIKEKFNVRFASRKKKIRKNFSYINWNSSKSIKKNFTDIDSIIHTAGPNYDECKKNFNKSKKFYDKITKKIIYIANQCKIKKIIFFSTIMVYDQNLKIISEKTKKFSKDNYAKLNLIAENHILNYLPQTKLNRIVVRISNAIGAPINKSANCWHLLCNNICKSLILKNKIILDTNGQQKKNFISINEICKKIKYLLNSNKNNISINLVSNHNLKVLEITNIIKMIYEKIYKKKSIIKIGNKRVKNNFKKINTIYNFNKIKNNNMELLKTEIKNTLLFCKKTFK